MIKVFYGKKGMGKTKFLVDTANKLAAESNGDVVFIDDSNQLMYDLKHKIRFINVSDFSLSGATSFFGFLCGIISEDFDIESIFIDGLTYIVGEDADKLEGFFTDLKRISAKFNIAFYMSMTGDPQALPEYLKEYVV